jgi:hypothetical protein
MTAQQAREILDCPACWCGRNKLPGQSLCRKCWMNLDDGLRRELREKIGQGFEQSYEMIVPMLKRHVRPLKAVPGKSPLEDKMSDLLEDRRAAWR